MLFATGMVTLRTIGLPFEHCTSVMRAWRISLPDVKMPLRLPVTVTI